MTEQQPRSQEETTIDLRRQVAELMDEIFTDMSIDKVRIKPLDPEGWIIHMPVLAEGIPAVRGTRLMSISLFQYIKDQDSQREYGVLVSFGGGQVDFEYRESDTEMFFPEVQGSEHFIITRTRESSSPDEENMRLTILKEILNYALMAERFDQVVSSQS